MDAFAGSGTVAYLLKSMGKQVISNDSLSFSNQIGIATIENSRYRLGDDECKLLLLNNPCRRHFIENTFRGIFYTPPDLRFLDNIWANIPHLPTRYHRALAIAALSRACVKRQPRGVFTVAGDPSRYKDGRRDLRMSVKDLFLDSVTAYNAVIFDNKLSHRATRSDIFKLDLPDVDLVYMDPPYVPRADDNCYIKRYHFLEGLASYWSDEGTEIVETSRVKKIPKRFTPFSYRRSAIEAFNTIFKKFKDSTLVLSYSSNGYPDLSILVDLMKTYKRSVDVFEKEHRYHFGTHQNVSADRTLVQEYLIVGQGSK